MSPCVRLYVPLVAARSVEHRHAYRDNDHCDDGAQHERAGPVERVVQAVCRSRARPLCGASVLARAVGSTDAPANEDAEADSGRDKDGAPPRHEPSMGRPSNRPCAAVKVRYSFSRKSAVDRAKSATLTLV